MANERTVTQLSAALNSLAGDVRLFYPTGVDGVGFVAAVRSTWLRDVEVLLGEVVGAMTSPSSPADPVERVNKCLLELATLAQRAVAAVEKPSAAASRYGALVAAAIGGDGVPWQDRQHALGVALADGTPPDYPPAPDIVDGLAARATAYELTRASAIAVGDHRYLERLVEVGLAVAELPAATLHAAAAEYVKLHAATVQAMGEAPETRWSGSNGVTRLRNRTHSLMEVLAEVAEAVGQRGLQLDALAKRLDSTGQDTSKGRRPTTALLGIASDLRTWAGAAPAPADGDSVREVLLGIEARIQAAPRDKSKRFKLGVTATEVQREQLFDQLPLLTKEAQQLAEQLATVPNERQLVMISELSMALSSWLTTDFDEQWGDGLPSTALRDKTLATRKCLLALVPLVPAEHQRLLGDLGGMIGAVVDAPPERLAARDKPRTLLNLASTLGEWADELPSANRREKRLAVKALIANSDAIRALAQEKLERAAAAAARAELEELSASYRPAQPAAPLVPTIQPLDVGYTMSLQSAEGDVSFRRISEPPDNGRTTVEWERARDAKATTAMVHGKSLSYLAALDSSLRASVLDANWDLYFAPALEHLTRNVELVRRDLLHGDQPQLPEKIRALGAGVRLVVANAGPGLVDLWCDDAEPAGAVDRRAAMTALLDEAVADLEGIAELLDAAAPKGHAVARAKSGDLLLGLHALSDLLGFDRQRLSPLRDEAGLAPVVTLPPAVVATAKERGVDLQRPHLVRHLARKKALRSIAECRDLVADLHTTDVPADPGLAADRLATIVDGLHERSFEYLHRVAVERLANAGFGDGADFDTGSRLAEKALTYTLEWEYRRPRPNPEPLSSQAKRTLLGVLDRETLRSEAAADQPVSAAEIADTRLPLRAEQALDEMISAVRQTSPTVPLVRRSQIA